MTDLVGLGVRRLLLSVDDVGLAVRRQSWVSLVWRLLVFFSRGLVRATCRLSSVDSLLDLVKSAFTFPALYSVCIRSSVYGRLLSQLSVGLLWTFS